MATDFVQIGGIFVNPAAVAVIAPHRGTLVDGVETAPPPADTVMLHLLSGVQIQAQGNAREIARQLCVGQGDQA